MTKVLAAVAALAVSVSGHAVEKPSMKVARNLAALLVAGRAVVAQNQPLINDGAKGDKGFTADAFGAAVAAEFKAKTGVELAALGASRDDKLIKALFDAEKQVVAEAQPVINLAGMGFKGFTPAVFGLHAAEKFGKATGLTLKQTSDRYRNPSNRPDAFEQGVLAKFAAASWEKGHDYAEVADHGGKRVLRYMQPLYIAKPCLSCHGEPKGELDIAGRAKEGYREGELRGAVSVIVPVAP
jgi:hypothetical protein